MTFLKGHRIPPDPFAYEAVPETRCWTVPKTRRADKPRSTYTTVRIAGQRVYAHRAFYERYRGPIPDGLHLDHLCRNPPCVNPDHLEPVSNAENLRRGIRVKLSGSDAAEIRHLAYQGWKQADIARAYSVDPSHVSRLAAGHYWS